MKNYCAIVVLLIAAAVPGLASGPVPEIVAHRGESHDAPENTLAAFKLAWERHDDTIELDVHLTKDNQLIVCHDADAKRTTGFEGKIKDTAFDTLRKLDAGSWKGPRWAGEKLPTLDEVLATIPDGKRCFIEIKVGPKAVAGVERAIKFSGKKPEQLAIISFKADSLAEAKRKMPSIPAFFLSDFKQDKETGVWSPTVDELIQKAKSIKADGLDLSHKGPIDEQFVQRVKAEGLKFHVYTIDELDMARKFAAYGVDGITTNKAAYLKRELNGQRTK